MKNLKLEAVTGVTLVMTGVTVITGWLIQSAMLVSIVPGFAEMVFNTALCFTLAGIALAWPAHKDHSRKLIQTILGSAIFLIGTAVFLQNTLNFSWGIDNPQLHSWLENSDSNPGRMATNISLGFILSGLSLVLLNRRSQFSVTTTQILSPTIILLGLMGTVGFFLKFELMYSWYQYMHMSLHTAICFLVLGTGISAIWYHSHYYQMLYKGREDQRIALVGGGILVTIAITAGLAGFAALRQQMETALGSTLQLNLAHRLELFENVISHEIEQTVLLAKRPSIIQNLQNINLGQDSSEHLQALNTTVQNALTSTFSTINIYDKNRRQIISAGNKATNVSLVVPLKNAPNASLMWAQGFILRVEQNIYESAKLIGSLVTETSLVALTNNLTNYRGIGATGEFAVCDSSPVTIWCFPMRNRKNAFSIKYEVEGQRLPITYAIAGKKGMLSAMDYRRRYVVAAFSPIGATGLNAVLKIDTEELFAPIRIQLDAVMLLILVLVMTGVILLRWQVVPLVRRLVASEQQARDVSIALANAVEGIAQVSDRGYYLSVNQAYADITGYSEEDFISKHWLFWLHPEDLKKMEIAYQEMVSMCKIEIEVRGIRKNASIFDTSLVIIAKKEKNNAFIGHYCFMKDITARKQAEMALKTSEKQFRKLSEQAPVGIYLTDLAGNCSYVNRQWCDIAGITEIEAAGVNWQSTLHVDDKAKVLKEWLTATQQKRDFSYEYRFQHTNGKIIWVSAKEVALYNNAGNIIGYLGTVTDINELKKVERMKNEFVSTVSHELRTPLTSIRGSLGLLAGEIAGPLSAQAKQLVNIANQNSERLLHLINDILDIEKIEAGKMDFYLQTVPLAALVRQAISNIKDYSLQQNTEILFEQPEFETIVNVDRARFLQVMANLLSNAIKFSPNNSTIKVSISLAENMVQVAVSDSGPGIPAEFHQRVFQKFAQADSSDTRQKGGTGLGLSIAKAIIEQMNGSIGFHSIVNQGTTFFILLPNVHGQDSASIKESTTSIPASV